MAIYTSPCHYCGRPAIHRFNNGNYCCSTRTNSCPAVKAKNKSSNTDTWACQELRDSHSTTCSEARTAESNTKSKATCLKKYGVDHVMKLQSTKEAIKSTCLEKYGVEHATKAETIKAKTKATCQERYGVDYAITATKVVEASKSTCIEKYGHSQYMSSSEFKKASVKTSLEKYGFVNASQTVEARNKAKATMLVKYGAENAFASMAIRDQIKKTLIDRYGITNPAHYAEFREKAELTNPYKHKEYRFPSETIIMVQGYEPAALDHLIKCGFTEQDIVTTKSKMPQIMYEFAGKIRRYYPDIFLPRLNLIIEVKSTYYFQVDKAKNLAKRAACKRLGFNFNFFIR